LRPILAGRGAVFVLHRAAPRGHRVLDPDTMVTADVLDEALTIARREGYAPIALDDLPSHLSRPSGRFVAFTFDDGYRDNLRVALPVFREHRAPLALYVTTGLVERTACYWWGALARLIGSRAELDLHQLGVPATLPTDSWTDQQTAYARLEAWVHEDLESRAEIMEAWCGKQGVDGRGVLNDDVLTWDELREMARDPLVTIGAHGVTHRRLALLGDDEAGRELKESRRRLESELNRPIRHLAYPYGGAAACAEREFRLASEAGYLTAVTTRRGNLFAEHAGFLTALPRRRLTEGRPDLRTLRRSLSGTDWFLRRGPRVVTPMSGERR
ncbi:MAG TPA: polysaccharide deacetylase family protein, partial [Vicinamibacterales bacterium]